MPAPGADRLLVPTPISADASVLELLPRLRAALNGSGPALRLGDDGEAVTLLDGDDDPHDPTAVAVTTSGSTGLPKVVLLSAGALLASAAATHDRLGGAGQWLLALPARHVAGVQVLVRSLVAGTTPEVLDLTGGFTTAGFVAATERLSRRRRRCTALVPTQLTRLLEAGDAALEAVRSYDAILVGGAATAPALLARAQSLGVRLVTTYGMSETSGGCVYDERPLDGVSVRIDPADGRIRLGGPTLARGYLGDPAATAGAFPTEGGRREFRTDDFGRFDGTRLTVLGRLDHVIVSGGVNVPPGPVEALLQNFPTVAEAVVVGLPDAEWGQRVAAAVVLRPGGEAPALGDLRREIGTHLSAASAPRQITVLDALPLRGPGKPDRAAITTLLAELPPLEGL